MKKEYKGFPWSMLLALSMGIGVIGGQCPDGYDFEHGQTVLPPVAFDAHINGVSHFLTAVLEEASVSSLPFQRQKIDLQYYWFFGCGRSPDSLFTKGSPPLFFSPYG